MSNLIEHLKYEFIHAGWLNGDTGKFSDEMQAEIYKCLAKLLAEFGSQGHSGTTAPYTLELFNKLARYQPISPLTGNDSEWTHVYDDDGPVYQNKRDGSIFKNGDGTAYWIEGKTFWNWFKDEDGKPFKSYYTSSDSHIDIKFPWTRPDEPEYVFVPTDEFPDEDLNWNPMDEL